MPSNKQFVSRDVEPAAPARMSGLTEGRMVHYVMADGAHRGASVARVVDNVAGVVNLQVFTDGNTDGFANEQGTYRVPDAPYSEEKEVGTWHWIEGA